MTIRAAMVLVAACPALLTAQQRDGVVRQPFTGTAVISGVVRSANEPSSTVPRAIVTVIAGSTVRSTLSGDDGRFSIEKLPAGTYAIAARKAGWLPAQHGATRPGTAGVPLVVADGARVDAPLTMFRGAAITGVLRDSLGEPLMGMPVIAIDARTGAAVHGPVPAELSTSDDRGVYRLYGLPAGHYFVATVPPAGTPGRTGTLSIHEMEAALAMLTNRAAAGDAPESGLNLPESRTVHYAPLLHPGTPYLEQAVSVAIGSGDDRAGIDINVTPVPVGSIGVKVEVDPSLRAGIAMELIPAGRVASALASSNRAASAPLAEQWTFNNLAPGRYRVLARAAPGGNSRPEIVQTRMPDGSVRESVQRVIRPPTDYLYGFADVDVQADDRASVTLTLQSGGVIFGQLRLDPASTAKLPDFSQITIGLEHDSLPYAFISRGTLTREAVSDVKPDGTFELRGIGPGRVRLAVSAPADGGVRWHARSARLGDRELLDEWLEFGPGLSLPDVVITLSDRRTGLDGVLQSASTQPGPAVSVVIVPVDRELWRAGSRRIVSSRPQSDGRFTFDVPPGDYALAAVTDFDPLDLTDPAWLEQIVGAGVKVTVAEGARTRQDLRIK
jgi:hypothetical protein